jgi:hypothetical protein
LAASKWPAWKKTCRLNFTPISENVKQKLQEKVAPSRPAWRDFLRDHDDSMAV